MPASTLSDGPNGGLIFCIPSDAQSNFVVPFPAESQYF